MRCILRHLVPCSCGLGLDEFQGLPILRTRDAAEIDKATIVVDVGGTYEPEKQRFDHHQKTFTETYSEVKRQLFLGGTFCTVWK